MKRDKLLAQLDDISHRQAKLLGTHGPDAVLAAPDPVATFDAAPLAIRQRVIDTLAVVTLAPGRHGSRVFDPASVQIDWK